jgi:hypothetical protein
MVWGKPQKSSQTKVTAKATETSVLVSAKPGEIKNQLEHLKQTVQKAFETRRRFWSYTALEDVYVLWLKWKGDRSSKKNAKVAATLFGIKREKDDHPLITMVKIVKPKGGVDTRDWVKALRFALQQGVAPKDFVAFLKANGGPRGCARKFKGH